MSNRETTPDADQLRLVEALLFAAAEPLAETAIAERLPEGADLPGLIAELVAHYAPRGVNLVQVGGGWTLRTAPDLGSRLNLQQKITRKLSRAAIETLAIIAYHQPVTRAEIEEIRGVVISKGTLDTLMETGWIEPRGRRETPGRPATWVTTDAFLLYFGLAGIRDLPGIEELRAAGLVGPRPVVSLNENLSPPLRGEDDQTADADDLEEAGAEADRSDPAGPDDRMAVPTEPAAD